MRIHPLHLALLVLMHGVLRLSSIQHRLGRLRQLLLLLVVRVKYHLLGPSMLLLQGLQEEHDNLWINDWHRLRAAAINCLRKTRICESLAEKEAQEYWLI